jgi:hypothetical protein
VRHSQCCGCDAEGAALLRAPSRHRPRGDTHLSDVARQIAPAEHSPPPCGDGVQQQHVVVRAAFPLQGHEQRDDCTTIAVHILRRRTARHLGLDGSNARHCDGGRRYARTWEAAKLRASIAAQHVEAMQEMHVGSRGALRWCAGLESFEKRSDAGVYPCEASGLEVALNLDTRS